MLKDKAVIVFRNLGEDSLHQNLICFLRGAHRKKRLSELYALRFSGILATIQVQYKKMKISFDCALYCEENDV